MAKKNSSDEKKLEVKICNSEEAALKIIKVDTDKKSFIIPKYGSTNFSYYTSLDTLIKILESGKIYINNVSKMNDETEKEYLGDEANKTFLLCLCQSSTEKIPMWYLYSGIFGDGAKLRFTKGNLQKLILSIKELEVINPNNDATPETIKRGDDFDLTCGWVFYVKDKDGKYTCKYKNEFYYYYNNEDDNENDILKGIPFVKNYPWEYEKEFRIVITVTNKDMVNQLEDKRLAINISSIIGKLDFMFGPEISKERKKKFYESEGFKNYLNSKYIEQNSNLKIKMNLWGRNICPLCNESNPECKQDPSKCKVLSRIKQ